MRLINADLIEWMNDNSETAPDRYIARKEQVDQIPEAKPKMIQFIGYWEYYRGKAYCTHCKTKMDGSLYGRNYCPECGALMRKSSGIAPHKLSKEEAKARLKEMRNACRTCAEEGEMMETQEYKELIQIIFPLSSDYNI